MKIAPFCFLIGFACSFMTSTSGCFAESRAPKVAQPEYQVLLDAAQDAHKRYIQNVKDMTAEKARERYVTELTEIAYRYLPPVRRRNWELFEPGFNSLNREIWNHPAPKDSDTRVFSKLRVGKRRSPRHDYIFYPDGKWSMLPVEGGVTTGDWSIHGNQYYDSGSTYTIFLLNKKFFVFTDGPEGIYFEKRNSSNAQ